MIDGRKTTATLAAWLFLSLGPAFAGERKTGGAFTIVHDLLGASAASVGSGGACVEGSDCLAGAVGQVSVGTQTNAAHSAGGGFFDFHYNFERLLVLLPGEIFVPGAPPGKAGSPSSQLINVPFAVRVYAVDNAYNVAST